jgi:hypothetical protein
MATSIDSRANAPVLHLRHGDLRLPPILLARFDRHCPCCPTGLLQPKRSTKTDALLPDDQCSVCGQRLRYTDIAGLRRQDHPTGGLSVN